MNDGLATIIYVIAPILCLMLIGKWIACKKFVSEKGAVEINGLVFRFFLPANLFLSIYNSELEESLNLPLIVLCVGGTLVMTVIVWLVCDRKIADRKVAPVIIHAIVRSNYVIFGLVVVGDFYPDKAGIASVVSAFTIPLINLLGVCLLEYYDNNGGGIKKTLIGILKSPLIISALAALALLGTGVRLPAIVEKLIGELSKISTPLALLAIGMRFEFGEVRRQLKSVTGVLILRLVIIPVVFCTIAIFMGFRDAQLLTALIYFGSPAAVATYTVSLPYDVDHQLAGALVVMTTVGCIGSLFLLLLIFHTAGFLVF